MPLLFACRCLLLRFSTMLEKERGSRRNGLTCEIRVGAGSLKPGGRALARSLWYTRGGKGAVFMIPNQRATSASSLIGICIRLNFSLSIYSISLLLWGGDGGIHPRTQRMRVEGTWFAPTQQKNGRRNSLVSFSFDFIFLNGSFVFYPSHTNSASSDLWFTQWSVLSVITAPFKWIKKNPLRIESYFDLTSKCVF